MKTYHFLNINPANMIMLKFHMLLLYNQIKALSLSFIWKVM